MARKVPSNLIWHDFTPIDRWLTLSDTDIGESDVSGTRNRSAIVRVPGARMTLVTESMCADTAIQSPARNANLLMQCSCLVTWRSSRLKVLVLYLSSIISFVFSNIGFAVL